jgi:arylsulfatase A-like enzyme
MAFIQPVVSQRGRGPCGTRAIPTRPARVLAGLLLAMVGAVGPIPLKAAEPAAPRPNVLFILIDDMGWADPACFGGVGVATPNFDRLAAEGTRFSQFYVASPICSASRAALITGQFPARNRITSYLQTRAGNRACEQADFLSADAPSFVRNFKAAGYATAHIGKWHLGGGRDVRDAPKFAAYGYDLGLGTYESPEPAAPLGLKSVPWQAKLEPQQVPRHDRTRWMVDQTLAFIREHPTKPWLVNLWPDDVHTPHQPSDEQRAGTPDGKGSVDFRAVLQETDRQIGRLLDGLREMKLEANTLVILVSDNGPEPSFKQARTGGLRGMKWSLYEGGIRTPLIARWPGVVAPGAVNESTLVAGVDFLPTLCHLANVPMTENALLDGEDLSAAFRGGKPIRSRLLFWEYGRQSDSGKGHRGFPFPGGANAKSPNVAVRDGSWKLLINADGTSTELYDLATDPNEARNLAAEKPEIAKRLSDLALEWRKSLPGPPAAVVQP